MDSECSLKGIYSIATRCCVDTKQGYTFPRVWTQPLLDNKHRNACWETRNYHGDGVVTHDPSGLMKNLGHPQSRRRSHFSVSGGVPCEKWIKDVSENGQKCKHLKSKKTHWALNVCSVGRVRIFFPFSGCWLSGQCDSYWRAVVLIHLTKLISTKYLTLNTSSDPQGHFTVMKT